MAKIVVTRTVKFYYNDNMDFHREDGPAWDFPSGYKVWCNDEEVLWPALK